ncbi:MAG: OstA-like protein [Bacteroidales bacterium]
MLQPHNRKLDFHVAGILWFPALLLILLASPFGISAQETRQIEYDAENMEYDKFIANGAFRLWDQVVFRHEGAIMYCDSAYYYPSLNSLDAYNRIYINQGDTLRLYGDYLHYDGNTRLAQVEGNVRLLDKDNELTTTVLDFDMKNNIGYYTNSADIVRGENNLRSQIGYYYARRHMYFFKDSVVIVNPDYTIYSDTLEYNTELNMAYMQGPTRIIGDSSYIYCEDGWYDMEKNISMLRENAYIENKKQTIKGDSLYYEQDNGIGKAYSNVELFDTKQNILLLGNFADYNENTEEALLTDSAVFVQINNGDSIFVHADTLRSELDTLGYKLIRAFYKVKLFKNDLQGKCDSLTYSFADSVIRLFHHPVLWSQDNQLSSQYIEIATKNHKIDRMYLSQSAFIANIVDSIRFNQIKGRDMICYFSDNELYKIDVNGNGESLYYIKDEEDLIGVNKSESAYIIILWKEGKADTIKSFPKPTAVLYPLDELPEDQKRMKDFKWLENLRPKSKEEIFIWTE